MSKTTVPSYVPFTTTGFSTASGISTMSSLGTTMSSIGMGTGVSYIDEDTSDEYYMKKHRSLKLQLGHPKTFDSKAASHPKPTFRTKMLKKLYKSSMFVDDSIGYGIGGYGNDVGWQEPKGAQINSLMYIENNLFFTYLYVMGYFTTNDLERKTISKILDKQTLNSIKNIPNKTKKTSKER